MPESGKKKEMVQSKFCPLGEDRHSGICGSVVKCSTRNQGVLGSSCTGSSEFFVEVSLGKTLQSPILVLMKCRKDMNNVSCHHDMTEILLKAA